MAARCLATLRFIDETKFIQDNRTEIVQWVRNVIYFSDIRDHMTGAAVDMAILLQLQGRYLGDAAEIANRLAFIASYSALAIIAHDLVSELDVELEPGSDLDAKSETDVGEDEDTDEDDEPEEDVVEDQTDPTAEPGEHGVSTPS